MENNTLPTELWVQIFSYTDGQSLVNVSQTCKGFRQIVSEHDELWKFVCTGPKPQEITTWKAWWSVCRYDARVKLGGTVRDVRTFLDSQHKANEHVIDTYLVDTLCKQESRWQLMSTLSGLGILFFELGPFRSEVLSSSRNQGIGLALALLGAPLVSVWNQSQQAKRAHEALRAQQPYQPFVDILESDDPGETRRNLSQFLSDLVEQELGKDALYQAYQTSLDKQKNSSTQDPRIPYAIACRKLTIVSSVFVEEGGDPTALRKALNRFRTAAEGEVARLRLLAEGQIKDIVGETDINFRVKRKIKFFLYQELDRAATGEAFVEFTPLLDLSSLIEKLELTDGK